ncbi:MAG TPA: prenyltransferase [Streptosporangiaceae bacterium]|nr:prenyltransferase [Streptosporangiaceae bacterium]
MPSPDFLVGSVSDGLPDAPGPAAAADGAVPATVRDTGAPAVPGILTAADILATGEQIAALQEPSGAIGWPDGHTDAWNHVECAMALSACGLTGAARRAYDWLRRTQRPDGSWPKRTVAEIAIDPAAESNQAAYVAVGTWHEYLLTGDESFLAQMWPTVRRAIGFVLALQVPRGEIRWQRTADGTPASYALLTGCSSTYQSLRCAARLARHMGEPQPGWDLAASRLGHVIACHPEAFADKSAFSMDWYYPVLAGPVRGPAARDRLAAEWAEFVVAGLGVRCVRDEPWVTGAETCELVMALDAVGDRARALQVYAEVQHLRDSEGAYWTGWQFANSAHFPAERSSWTSAAMILAADALSGTTPGSGLFRDAAAGMPASCPADALAGVPVSGPADGQAACGCAVPAAG